MKTSKKDSKTINVLFASSEAEPFFKVGGLGDYAGSLPQALRKIRYKDLYKIDIRVVLPLYDPKIIKEFNLQKLFSISIPTESGNADGTIYITKHKNRDYYFIKQDKPALNTTKVYDNDQYSNAYKFTFFSLACLELLKELDWHPDIIHANDWHTALIIHQIKQSQQNNSLKTLLTIHNMPFMGYGSEQILNNFSIQSSTEEFFPDWAQNLPLPMGIAAADKIVAVSPSYSDELKTNYFAYGLEDYFINHSKKLTGIINGIDTELWDPSADTEIINNYSLSSIQNKVKNKNTFLKGLGLADETDYPLLVVISRLENQKGIDLILDALTNMQNKQWKAIILGTGHKGYEHAFRALERERPDKVRAFMEYNSTLARKLYAAGDIILMPSLYEPCGLSQMIAMRYGCVPVAHSVGGLKDSIITKPESERTGFLFEKPSSKSFVSTLEKAIAVYQEKNIWKLIQKNGMSMDFSWDQSATKYAELYFELSRI